MIARLVAAVLAIGLSGCTAASLRDQVDELEAADVETLEAWARVTRRDVAAALELAELSGDQIGAACWRAVLPELEHLEAYRRAAEALEASGTGYAFLAQRTRNVHRWLRNPPEELLVGCAPLVSETRSTLRGIARIAGGL